jgi:shikimate kinase
MHGGFPLNVILLGFHGSGKTVIGRKLADKLWATFVDVDETIAGQLAREGADPEDYLPVVTAGQEKILGSLSKDPQSIVAASAVAVPDEALIAALKQHSRLVYLKAEPAALAARIAADPVRARGNYPLFRRAETADIAAGLARRDAAWTAMADLVLDTSPLPVETVIRLVVRMAM